MRWLALLAVPALWAQSLPSGAQVATVETTADASIHAGKLNGTAEVLEASGPGDAVLLRFRTALIEKWTVRKAMVAFHVPKGVAVPEQVMVSGVEEAWTQGSVAAPRWGTGVAVATHPLKDDWVTFEVPLEVAVGLARGQYASIAISVSGEAKLAMHSHRTGQFMPYLLVRGKGTERGFNGSVVEFPRAERVRSASGLVWADRKPTMLKWTRSWPVKYQKRQPVRTDGLTVGSSVFHAQASPAVSVCLGRKQLQSQTRPLL